MGKVIFEKMDNQLYGAVLIILFKVSFLMDKYIGAVFNGGRIWVWFMRYIMRRIKCFLSFLTLSMNTSSLNTSVLNACSSSLLMDG